MNRLNNMRGKIAGYDNANFNDSRNDHQPKAQSMKYTPYESRFGVSSALRPSNLSVQSMYHESVFLGSNDQPSTEFDLGKERYGKVEATDAD